MASSESEKLRARRFRSMNRSRLRLVSKERYRAKIASGWKPSDEKIAERRKKAKIKYAENKDSMRAYQAKWREKNASTVNAGSLRYYYKKKNTVPIEALRKQWSGLKMKRYHSDLSFRIGMRLKARVRKVLVGVSKSAPTLEMLGCSIQKFLDHMEQSWQPGMSWSNYGCGSNKWNIDHIKPCAAFNLASDIDQRICFHYSNLRPCWHTENISNGSMWNGIKHKYKRYD